MLYCYITHGGAASPSSPCRTLGYVAGAACLRSRGASTSSIFWSFLCAPIGAAGATNAALLAAAIVGNAEPELRRALERFREERRDQVLANPDPSLA